MKFLLFILVIIDNLNVVPANNDNCGLNDLNALMVRLRQLRTEFNNLKSQHAEQINRVDRIDLQINATRAKLEVLNKANGTQETELKELRQDINNKSLEINKENRKQDTELNKLRQDIAAIKEEIKLKCPAAPCPDSSCGDEWVSYNNYCYYFENINTATFEEARLFCKQKSSNLLYVEDNDENSFILRMLGRFKPSYSWLIGLTDQSTEGIWKWIDINAPARFIKWAPDQPQGHTGENCVGFFQSDSYQWHDIPCAKKSL
ncbi:C-type lectin domain family 4 member D-like isoform X2 [Ruditapes philippinarum]|uniref:C-type lectin domain family 4 member D-like isoform X2 n=1 Tax=Ruditapes philippinarum TaxID=129788 RepID=UPI00295B8971|nr:C-type lectin domain family 4 member D-like isoform X2 [Ruditapes philippinarum]